MFALQITFALQDDDLQELGGVALGVLSGRRLQHRLAHGQHGAGVVRVGEEGVRVHCDVVVEQRHHVHEVVDAVAVEDGVDRGQDAPHGRADRPGGEVAGQRQHLLVELCDRVAEDVRDGLRGGEEERLSEDCLL